MKSHNALVSTREQDAGVVAALGPEVVEVAAAAVSMAEEVVDAEGEVTEAVAVVAVVMIAAGRKTFKKYCISFLRFSCIFSRIIHYRTLVVRLYQNLALKSSEQVRKAASVGEWVMYRTEPLWPRDKSCFLDALRESQQHNEVVASSGNMTKSSVWLKAA